MVNTKDKSYQYKFRYCNQAELCLAHGLTYKTVERWICDHKDKGQTLPGRIKIPGVRAYIYDPQIFHDEFLVPYLNGSYRNEYERQELLVISNNLKNNREKVRQN